MSLNSRLFRAESGKRGISFQLNPDGVRYFFVGETFRRSFRAEIRNSNRIRDISTQYAQMSGFGLLALPKNKEGVVKDRIIAHAERFYPEFVIPDDPAQETFAWVAFPMLGAALKDFGSPALVPYAVNLQVASGLRAFSIEEMTATIFGEAPRHLQAAAAKSLVPITVRGTYSASVQNVIDIDNLTMGSLLRGYLPPNQMAEVLGMNFGKWARIQNLDKVLANEIRLLLRRFNPKRIMRLVDSMREDAEGGNDNGFMMLTDAARQYAVARKDHPEVRMDLSRQFRSMRELHDSISHEYRKLKNPDLEISYDEDILQGLSNITLPDGAKLVWPGSTYELLDWSSDKVMNNCIFSYGKEAAEGRSLLLGIVDASGKMVVNLMIRGRSVIQCYGKANQSCTDEPQLEALFDGLIEADVINEENDHKRWIRDPNWGLDPRW